MSRTVVTSFMSVNVSGVVCNKEIDYTLYSTAAPFLELCIQKLVHSSQLLTLFMPFTALWYSPTSFRSDSCAENNMNYLVGLPGVRYLTGLSGI